MADQSDLNAPIQPSQIAERNLNSAIVKTTFPFLPLLLLSILAGIYIAFGGVFSSVVATGMTDVWPFGFVKLLQGIAFSLGLILVVVGGAELFTGNMMMVMALSARKIKFLGLLRNWVIVYLGNFAGSILVAFLMVAGKTYKFSHGELGHTMLLTATAKVQYGFSQAIALGILCNVLVCLAVWLALSAKSTTDKILAVLFPISAFIAAGFEHCVANMYIIPLGLLIKQFDPVFTLKWTSGYPDLNWLNFLMGNLLPVTIGNMIGGILFVGMTYYWIYVKKSSKIS